MQLYLVTCTQLVPDDKLRHDDFADNPSGTYYFEAEDEESALDQFHDDVAIKCLDDFSIDVELT